MKKTLRISTLLTAAALTALAAGQALACHENGKGKGEKFAERHFEQMDTNKDGVISKSEMTDSATKRFSEMDANKDGKVTKEEAKAYGEKKRAEWKLKHKGEKSPAGE